MKVILTSLEIFKTQPSLVITLFEGGESGDVFVSKLDSNGDVLWAKNFGGNSFDYGSAIDIDDDGNTYITGEFQNQIQFGDTTLEGGIFSDVFVAKLDSKGDVLWAKDFGNSGSDRVEEIVVDDEGNSYLFMAEGGNQVSVAKA